MLAVGVLGEVEVFRDGLRLSVPAGLTTELLIRLAVDAGRRVRADVLIEDLWGQPVDRNTLQAKVSTLRRALGDRSLVVGSADSYQLVIDPEQVDASRVLRLAAGAAVSDSATALGLAEEGLALFRGEPLADVGNWAEPHRARLLDVRLGLLETAMAARVDLGAGAELVTELQALVRLHPLRERLWACLITVLYRAGRQADALATYRQVRQLLDAELGIRPGPALHEVERQVLQQTVPVGPPRERSTPGNLPTEPQNLVGRAAEAAAVRSILGEHRLVSVVGPAGVGKTRLATHVGRQLRIEGGVWLVRLDQAEAGSRVPQLVAETLERGDPAQLIERLRSSATVLLLDNCEHVVDSVAALAVRLLDAAPQLRILATGQVMLGVTGEAVYRLPPLSPEASIELFVERAHDLRPQLALDDDLVGEVCRALDGLPLAIELAAARVRSLSVRDIARRLDDRFAVLQDPSSHRPLRRRALGGAIAWSYDLLFPDDQRGLWALSCFAGSASLDALEQVLAALEVPAGAVLDCIGRLVDRSLVATDVTADGAMRYRLLDSIRTYAADRLQESGLAAIARRAHASWYADAAERCDRIVRGPGQPECLELVRAERANIDAALAWTAGNAPTLGNRIALGFGWTWVVLGDGVAAAARIRRALAPDFPVAGRARSLMRAGWLEASAGDVALAAQDLDDAHVLVGPLAGTAEGDLLAADLQRHRAFVGIQQGRPQAVRESAAASLQYYRRLDLRWHCAASLLLGAFGSIMLGETATARRDADEAVSILRPLGDSWGLVHGEAMLGAIAQAEHRFEDAARALHQAAAESERLGFTGQAALHLTTLARVQQRGGDPAAATATLERAIDAATAGGDLRLAGTARIHLARLLRAAGQHEAAREQLERADAWYRSAGDGDGALLARCLLAAAIGNGPALRALLDQTVLDHAVLDHAGAGGKGEARLYALDALAHLAAVDGDFDTARQMLAESDELAPGLAHLVDEADRFDRAAAQRLLSTSGPRR